MRGSAEQQALRAAETFRQEHRLGAQPLGDLVALIEQTTGHDVAVLDVGPDEHGLTMRDPARGKVFIGVARSTHPMRQRSSLVHELAHVIFEDRWTDAAERSPEEIRADAFARHLLIPAAGLEEFLGDARDASEALLSDVVQRFLVSPAIAAIALRDAGRVSPETATEWMKLGTRQLATRYGWRDHYAALQADSQRLRAPQGLLSRAIDAYEAGVLSAQAIATLRGMRVETVLSELEEAGVIPRRLDEADFELEELPDVDVDLRGLGDDGERP